MSSWNGSQKYFSSNKMLRDVPTFKLKYLPAKHFLDTYLQYLLANLISTCNLIFFECNFNFIGFYGISTHINNNRKITLRLINSPRFGYGI